MIIEVLAGAAFIVLFLVLAALWANDRANRGMSTDLPWGSRRRAVTETLDAATTHLGEAPSSTAAPEDGTFGQRVLDPIARVISRGTSRVSPTGYVDSVRRRLTLGGRGRPRDLDRFLAARLTTVALIPVAFISIQLLPLPRLYRLLAFLIAVIALFLGPEASLDRRVRLRQEQVLRDLPHLVDLLMISVEAGLGFDQALSRAVSTSEGPLAEEFARFLGEVRLGADRVEAMEALDQRTDVPELRSFLMALVQAERFGVSIAPILKSQASEIRAAQRLHVQELAQKAPVKMLFPLVFCVLPALFIVIIGPAAIQIYHTIIKPGIL